MYCNNNIIILWLWPWFHVKQPSVDAEYLYGDLCSARHVCACYCWCFVCRLSSFRIEFVRFRHLIMTIMICWKVNWEEEMKLFRSWGRKCLIFRKNEIPPTTRSIIISAQVKDLSELLTFKRLYFMLIFLQFVSSLFVYLNFFVTEQLRWTRRNGSEMHPT